MKQEAASSGKKGLPGGRRHLFRGLTGIFLSVAVLAGSLLNVAGPWEAYINDFLGLSSDSVTRSTDPADYRYLSDFETAGDLVDGEIGLNTRLEAEGAVLLKGDPQVGGSLAVTLFGMRSQVMQYGGTMGSTISEDQAVRLADALTESGFSVNPTMVAFYEGLEDTYQPGRVSSGNNVDTNTGTVVNEVPRSEYGAAQESSYAAYSDAAIIVLGRDATEGGDYYPGADGVLNAEEFSQSATGNILSLSNEERDLVAYVESQGFEKVIVLINADNSMELEELKQDDGVDSILWIGTPGCYGTYGIAEILNGTVTPSGHLTETYAVNTAKAPAAVNFGAYTFTNADEIDTSVNNALRSRWYLVENEGIYIGYKYYETRYYDAMLGQGMASLALHGETYDGGYDWDYDNEVSYAFGYGLEGSTFSEEITGLDVDWSGETDSTATVLVTNTGDVSAKHTVQLYVSAPYTGELEKAAIQLVGYGKTGEAFEADYTQTVLLAPGESETLTITFNTQDFMSYDENLAHDGVTGAYRLEAGTYYFATGNGSHEAVNAVLAAQYPDVFSDLDYTGTVTACDLPEEVTLTESNGTLIQNQLTDADLNSYDTGTSVTTLSRSDWAGTWPEEITALTATEEMITLLRNPDTLSDAPYEVSESLTYGANYGVSAAELVGLDYEDPLYDQVLDEVTLDTMIGFYTAKLAAVPEISLPKYYGADSPVGIISFLGKYTEGSIFEVSGEDAAYGHETNVYVGENVVAATFSHLLASEEGRMIGNDSLWTGINTWNAPGMNIHRTQYNGRNEEYYSEDAVLNGYMCADVVAAAQDKGLVVYMKHFAFNDQETNRDGAAVFLDEQAARENELRGYAIAVRRCDVSGIMTSFNRVGCTHASASQGLCTGILLGEWGYDGMIITDSVKSAQYFRPVADLYAGNAMMLGGTANASVWNLTEDAVSEDLSLQYGLREAFHKTLYTIVNSNAMNGITASTNVSTSMVWWQAVMYTLLGVSGVLAIACGTAWVVSECRSKKADGKKEEQKA